MLYVKKIQTSILYITFVCFSNKREQSSNIKCVESNKLLQDYQKITGKLNNFSKNIFSNLNINENTDITNHNSDNVSDPVYQAVCKYKFHPSILRIKSKLEIRSFLCFNHIKI